MKKIVAFISIVLLLSCEEINVVDPPKIDLGISPLSTGIISINTNGSLSTVIAKTTVGAKYSLQLYQFGSFEPIRTKGFVATSDTTRMVLDFVTVPSGIYDLSLTDISGNTNKKPLIIN